MRGGGGGGQTSLRLGYCCIWLSEPLMMVFINQLSPLLSSPPSLCSQYSQRDAEVPRGER